VDARGGRTLNLEPSLLGWVLSALLIGYMSGALNRRSEDFRRMVLVGIVATAIGGFFLIGMFQLSPSNVIALDLTGFATHVATRIATGVIVAVVAKVFMWYGVNPHRK